MLETSIGDALFTKTQQRVLSLLYAKPDESFYTNEILRWVDMGRGTVTRELARLVAAGVLTVSPAGNQRHYQANSDCPVYSELLGIVRKSFGVADALRSALSGMDERIDLAFVYGSLAKGTDSKSSDLDLMLVGEGLKFSDVVEVLLPLEATLQRPIHPTVYEFSEFTTKLKQGHGFLTRIMDQPKMWVKGCEDDIGKFIKN